MENKSILDQIMTNNQAEEVAKLDAVDIINNLFGELNERERDILNRRFGLFGKKKETLEQIGAAHKLTRERIRQIETSSVKKLRLLKNIDQYVSGLKRIINQLMTEHGGLMEKEYLFNSLAHFSVDGLRAKKESEKIHKSHFDFLISRLLYDEFEEILNSAYFKNAYKLKYQSMDHLEGIVEELLKKIAEIKKVFLTEEVINLIKELESYKNNLEKLEAPNSLDISFVLETDLFTEDREIINKNKIIYSILQAAQKIEQNKFGYWGHAESREVKPKTINDKIYLVLKNYRKPMHFVEIADRINKINFDDKKANPATVHNELILDGKYILVGRGLYGLKEWGFEKGAVADVIEDILVRADKPLTQEDIIDQVLKQRLVRKATINLALMNKQKFEKLEDGTYKAVNQANIAVENN